MDYNAAAELIEDPHYDMFVITNLLTEAADTVGDLRLTTDYTFKQINRQISDLEQTGLLSAEGSGVSRTYNLTDKGRKFLVENYFDQNLENNLLSEMAENLEQ